MAKRQSAGNELARALLIDVLLPNVNPRCLRQRMKLCKMAETKGGFPPILSENIRAARKAKGLSQQELALKLNVVRQTVSKWEDMLHIVKDTQPELIWNSDMACVGHARILLYTLDCTLIHPR